MTQIRNDTDRKRRISQTYRPHLEAIALMYVRAGEVKTETARQVRLALPHLKGFKPARIDSWEGNPEWDAALNAARLQASAEKALPPESRGARLLQFAQAALREIESAYETAREEGDEKEKKALEDRIIKLHDALRAEERHQDTLKTAAAHRDMRTFIGNLIGLLKGLPAEFEYRLREALKNPGRIVMGDEQ